MFVDVCAANGSNGGELKETCGTYMVPSKTFYWIFSMGVMRLACAPHLAKRLALEKFLLAALVERL
jgi:hypothetical protein